LCLGQGVIAQSALHGKDETHETIAPQTERVKDKDILKGVVIPD